MTSPSAGTAQSGTKPVGDCSASTGDEVGPYARIGFGVWTANVFKERSSNGGWEYHFVLQRDSVAADGTPMFSNAFQTVDLMTISGLVRNLAIFFLDDGCLDDGLKRELRRLQDGYAELETRRGEPVRDVIRTP